MAVGYDAIDLRRLPAVEDDAVIFGYTDGRYSDVDEARALYPRHRIVTISAIGQTRADVVDCEPGCVWPPEAAVSLAREWGAAIYADLDLYQHEPSLMLVPDRLVAAYGLTAPGIGEVAWQSQSTTGYDRWAWIDDRWLATLFPPPGGTMTPPTPPAPRLNAPIVAAIPAGEGGYWLIGADGGIFAFGAAKPISSVLPRLRLQRPIVAAIPAGPDGIWLIGADGGVFPAGTAPMLGSLPGLGIHPAP